MSAHGTFHWNELMTRDPDRAKRFYAETIGWEYQPMEMPDGEPYWVCLSGGEAVGGIFRMTDDGVTGRDAQWMPYLCVDDIDERVSKAREAGAEVLREPWEIAGVGRIAMLREPDGAVVGWMTPAPPLA